jgi:VanZ family protein
LKKPYFVLYAALGWFIISVVLLTLPGTAFPKEDWLDKIWMDKWIHIGMFSILAALWCRYWYLLKMSEHIYKFRKAFILIGLICLGYGIAMEFVQKYFIPLRSFDIGDIVADAVGATIGSVFSIRRYIKK